ncbi:hypothetical protein MPER_08435 [Moniliophthora perniciosa FA553]|nr:hypothetical protein MPER_08435 [Moniliophthora perniciosa FA553]
MANGAQAGNGTIDFNRAGLFRVVVFDASDQSLKRSLVSQTVTVYVNPTSAVGGVSRIPLSTAFTGSSSGSSQSASEPGSGESSSRSASEQPGQVSLGLVWEVVIYLTLILQFQQE